MDSKVLGSQSDDLMTNDKKRGGCKDCPYYRENTNVTTIRDYGKTETGFAGLCINPEYVKKLKPTSKTIIKIGEKTVKNAILSGLAITICEQGNS